MVTVFIPVYNEEQIIADNLLAVHRYLVEQGLEHEILVGDNGSTDSTAQILAEIKSTIAQDSDTEWLRSFSLSERGPGLAFIKGVEQARGEYFVTLDADLSSNLSFIPQATYLLKFAPMVVGSKSIGSQRRSVFRVLGSSVYIWCARRLFNLNLTDYSIGCKAFRRAELLVYSQNVDPWTGFILELALGMRRAGLEILQLSVQCDDRRKSHFSLCHEAVYRFSHLGKLWWNLR